MPSNKAKPRKGPRKPEHSAKFHRCVEQAKALTKVKLVRAMYVSDMLIGGISQDYINY